MTGPGRKTCVVVYATRERQFLWTVDLAENATIGEALEEAERRSAEPDVPWGTAPVGIFGELRERSERPVDGDRIELYRPLAGDPRARRREVVQQQRKKGSFR